MENKYNMAIENNEILISDAFINYVSILNKNINELYFIHNGKYLSIDNNKKIIDFIKQNIIIICSECENFAIANSYDFKLSIENCVNNHKITDLSIDVFLYL